MNARTLLRQLALATVLLGTPVAANAQLAVGIGISVHIGPPAIPVYVQPPCPAPNYMWTPGYWAWGGTDYYWVPGTWVVAPQPGFLWTPGYWGFVDGVYSWHVGYWGPHVGFYGGINYGFGYGGVGFVGGAWHGGVFAYNTAVLNVNRTVIHNVYVDNTVVHNFSGPRPAFNGGPNGVRAEPTAEERAFASEHHIAATQAQMQHEHFASQDRANFAAANHGMPAHAALARPATSAAAFSHARPAGAGPGPRPAAAGPHPGPRPNEAMRPGPHPQAARPEGHPQAAHPQHEEERKKDQQQ
jgi:hypothetical protein